MDKEELRKLYIEEELSLRQIAKVMGCSHENVRLYLNKYDIKLRARGEKRRKSVCDDTKNIDAVLSVYEPGMYVTEIANLVGLSAYICGAILRDSGIDTSTKSASFRTRRSATLLDYYASGDKISDQRRAKLSRAATERWARRNNA